MSAVGLAGHPAVPFFVVLKELLIPIGIGRISVTLYDTTVQDRVEAFGKHLMAIFAYLFLDDDVGMILKE